MLKAIRWCFMGLLCLAFPLAHAVPVLLVDASGNLTGADAVDVGGTLYNVRFVEGTCIALFNGCDSVTDFPFQTQLAADIAMTALLNQVIVDGILGNFDSDPTKTLGCSDPDICHINTPYDVDLGFSSVYFSSLIENPAGSGAFLALGYSHDIDNSSFLDPRFVFAQWTLATAVPAPGTIALLVGGLAGLALRWRAL